MMNAGQWISEDANAPAVDRDPVPVPPATGPNVYQSGTLGMKKPAKAKEEKNVVSNW